MTAWKVLDKQIQRMEVRYAGTHENAPDCGVLELAGHTVRHVTEEGKPLYTLEEAFPDAHPGRIVRGLRVKEGITQDELAARLGI